MKICGCKARFFILLCVSVLLTLSITLYSHAENCSHPDIKGINKQYYYSDEYSFFLRPDKGYVLISTNMINKSKAALLDENGNFDYYSAYQATIIDFVYQKAEVCDNYIYLIGKFPAPQKGVIIGRINLSNGKLRQNKILNVECDFSRDFTADKNGRLSIFTASLGQKADKISHPNVYIFDDTENNINLSPEMIELEPSIIINNREENSSNSSESSETNNESQDENDEDNKSDTSEDTNSRPDESKIEPEKNYYFDTPVTLDYLQAVLDNNNIGQKVRVISDGKHELKSGYVGTGMTIEIINKGNIETKYTAITAGDLDGLGTVTNNDYRILYDYLTQPPYETEEILIGPFYEAAKLTDDLKADKSDRNLHTSDLLKIKKIN